MNWLEIFEVVSFIVTLPIIFIGTRRIMDIRITDLIFILMAAVLPFFNIFVALAFLDNKIIFKKVE